MYAVSVPVDQLVGKTLGGFEIRECIGQGKVTAVFLAHQHARMRDVMLAALLLPEQCGGRSRERFMERFNQIAAKLVQMQHPHVLPTYSFGEQFGYPYLVTPYVEEGSLAQILKQQTRLSPMQTLMVLRQIADGLDYAHSQGVVHGTLKPTNILIDSQQNIHITALGLARMLEMRDIGNINHPQPHLFSVAGTFLYSPEFIAPEVVQGAPVDARSDIYSLGIIIFTLLAGSPPFTGKSPFDVIMQHVQQPVPSLQTFSSDIPAALDLVIQRALERDPAQRYSSARKLVKAFERVLGVIEDTITVNAAKDESLIPDATMPPTVNWFEEEVAGTGTWQAVDSSSYQAITTQNMPAAQPNGENGNWQIRPPIVTDKMAAIRATTAQDPQAKKPPFAPWQEGLAEDKGEDPFAFWATTPDRVEVPPPPSGIVKQGAAPGASPQPRKSQSMKKEKRSRKMPSLKGRRRVILLATGGVVAASVLAAGGVVAASYVEKVSPLQLLGLEAPNKRNTNNQRKNKKTTIGSKTMDVNTSKTFTNPADGQPSLLVHLPNGDFVAYKQACTHQQVLVTYDPVQNVFVCPRHGSQFDPANNGAVLQGPATQPLPMVAIHINADGTITAG